MVSIRGIEVNLEKIQAILEMDPLRTTKDIQKFNERITGLSRFISKSGERCLPFFKVLRGECPAWNDDCQWVFESLKMYLLSPPLLSVPLPAKDLLLYLSATDSSASAVLVREATNWQLPIHHISHILHGAKLRYSPFEKLSFALTTAARKLRQYFQVHSIKVVTDQPLRRVLHSPEVSRRLQKWAMKLSEFDIDFLSKSASKGHVLADFRAELTTTEQLELPEKQLPWILHIDGASGKHTQGISIALTSH
ncbi:hypothetical protein AXF42_Ash019825 [Apostasia shenzhenica]|uniref:Reverse transcriptase RNase H-like domain-containing protein n=1 Tax=Apostasia shenzhenica TaxID=1088818 RepID=A0A2I0ARE4_9ASPA|nr:hypothetical protein AXF42_Ash019825 [Apostasia shenzhenica]